MTVERERAAIDAMCLPKGLWGAAGTTAVAIACNLVSLFKQRFDCFKGPRTRIENADPPHRGINWVRHDPIERGIVMPGVEDAAVRGRMGQIAEHRPIGFPADANVESADTGAVEVRDPVIGVVRYDRGERQTAPRVHGPARVVKDEGVARRRDHVETRECRSDVLKDLAFIHLLSLSLALAT